MKKTSQHIASWSLSNMLFILKINIVQIKQY